MYSLNKIKVVTQQTLDNLLIFLHQSLHGKAVKSVTTAVTVEAQTCLFAGSLKVEESPVHISAVGCSV